MHHIGTRKRLFIDDRFIVEPRNVAITVNPPAKAGAVNVEAATAPSVVEHDGTCFLYQGLNGVTSAWTSADGITWEPRGALRGACDDAGILTSINSVFVDPREPEYPFKGLCEFIRRADAKGDEPGTHTEATQPGGLRLCRSRDGLEWEYLPDVAIPFLCDTQNQVLYDPWRDCYVAYVRAFPTLGGPCNYKRCVGRLEIPDLYAMPWPHGRNPANVTPEGHDYPYIQDELEIVLGPDADDPPMTDLYNPCMHVYAEAQDVYLAFPAMYRCWGYGQENCSAGRDHRGNQFNDGLFETHLAVSRDGVHFTRYRTPYLPAGMVRSRDGTEGDLDCGLMMLGIGMLRRGEELWQYYFGARRTHMTREDGERLGFRGEGIFRAVQRLDGFVSVDADHRGGEFVTPPVVFEGSRLQLNAACHGLGEVWVEVQDDHGVPIPGFGRAESVSIDRNGTAQEVWWQGGPEVSALAGRPVRLRFVMRSAKLFAFQFVAAS